MTPPSSAFKKATKKEEPPLTAVVILDVFDQRFAPIQESYPCIGTFPICNVPSINLVLSWLMRTEVKNVLLVVSGLNAQHAEKVLNEWKLAFVELTLVVCDGVTSVGDCMREMVNRELITGDFMLISNPTAVVSSDLSTQIAEFRKRRRENADNVMTLLYSNRENPEGFVLGISSETQKLMLYPHANSLNQVKAEKFHFYEGVEIRRDITTTGIALCSRLIATQFSDNFDFIGIDDVVREILSKDDILGMSVHVDVLPSKDRAFCAYDYESLIILNTLMLERWFYPLVPERSDPTRFFSANPRNLYLEEEGNEICIKANTWILNDSCSTVALGVKTKISYDTTIRNSCIGAHTEISSKTRIFGSIIGKNCKIGENCQIEYAFIGDNVTIPSGTHIPKETIIGNGVVYPKDLPTIQHSAIFKKAIDEDKYEKLSSQAVGSVHVVKYRHGGPFWRRAVDGRTNFAVDGEDSSSEGTTSEEEDEGLDDNVRQFYDEVFESMEKILESENQVMRNLILEINSSKLACNVSPEEVAKNVFAAFLELPHNQELRPTQALIERWNELFTNYYQSSSEGQKVDERKQKSQINLLLAVEEKFVREEGFRARTPNLVHFLYQQDILDDNAIIEWFDSIDISAVTDGMEAGVKTDLKERMRRIVDWLKEDEEEESSDEEEESSDEE
ncbi:hypothetical protein CRE_01916 [Caenorhabditis remanei]|uniref:Translation initiation factor eIF2B subunit epsilon n=1 Tax=Caenorhabditis remanei TaxID=31234 RepID=E3LGA2_CAERE|nr:hypothetical protein CRE_01916 [Caenorhabditis remanei]